MIINLLDGEVQGLKFGFIMGEYPTIYQNN